jgi:phage gpG-like protein
MSLDNQNIHGADELVRRLQAAKQYIKDDVPEVIGTEAVNHFKRGFQNEGFTDSTLNKWASRKTKVRQQKKILTGQGGGDHLADSIDYKVEGETITIYTDKIYGEIHNEGGEIPVTPQMKKFFWAKSFEARDAGEPEIQEQYKFMALAKTIKMQKRQFMGESKVLTENITNKIMRDLTQILNG